MRSAERERERWERRGKGSAPGKLFLSASLLSRVLHSLFPLMISLWTLCRCHIESKMSNSAICLIEKEQEKWKNEEEKAKEKSLRAFRLSSPEPFPSYFCHLYWPPTLNLLVKLLWPIHLNETARGSERGRVIRVGGAFEDYDYASTYSRERNLFQYIYLHSHMAKSLRLLLKLNQRESSVSITFAGSSLRAYLSDATKSIGLECKLGPS